MTEMESKYLRLARLAKEENNTEDAKRYYDLVRTENPDNGEARFFYLYYKCWDGVKGKWGENYVTFRNGAVSAVRATAKMDIPEDERIAMLSEMIMRTAETYKASNKIFNELNNRTGTIYVGKLKYEKVMPDVTMFLEMGNAVEEAFPANESAMNVAVEAWKCGIKIVEEEGLETEPFKEYAAKIQKVDPSYVLPEKTGFFKQMAKKSAFGGLFKK